MTREEALKKTIDTYRSVKTDWGKCYLCGYALKIYFELPVEVLEYLRTAQISFCIFCPVYHYYNIPCVDLPAESSYQQYHSNLNFATRLKHGKRIAETLEKLI